MFEQLKNMKQKIYKIKNQGFTLIELIVVIAVIGIISTIGVSSFTNYLKIARDEVKKDEVYDVIKALQSYQALYASIPRDSGGSLVGLGVRCGTTACASCAGQSEFNNEMQILVSAGFLEKAPSSNFCWFDYSSSSPPYIRIWSNLEINPNIGNTGITSMNWATNLNY